MRKGKLGLALFLFVLFFVNFFFGLFFLYKCFHYVDYGRKLSIRCQGCKVAKTTAIGALLEEGLKSLEDKNI